MKFLLYFITVLLVDVFINALVHDHFGWSTFGAFFSAVFVNFFIIPLFITPESFNGK